MKRKKKDSIQTLPEITINKNDNPALTDLSVCPSLAQGMSPSCCNLSHVTCTPTKNNYNANISWISGLYQAPVVQKKDNTLDWINDSLSKSSANSFTLLKISKAYCRSLPTLKHFFAIQHTMNSTRRCIYTGNYNVLIRKNIFIGLHIEKNT